MKSALVKEPASSTDANLITQPICKKMQILIKLLLTLEQKKMETGKKQRALQQQLNNTATAQERSELEAQLTIVTQDKTLYEKQQRQWIDDLRIQVNESFQLYINEQVQLPVLQDMFRQLRASARLVDLIISQMIAIVLLQENLLFDSRTMGNFEAFKTLLELGDQKTLQGNINDLCPNALSSWTPPAGQYCSSVFLKNHTLYSYTAMFGTHEMLTYLNESGYSLLPLYVNSSNHCIPSNPLFFMLHDTTQSEDTILKKYKAILMNVPPGKDKRWLREYLHQTTQSAGTLPLIYPATRRRFSKILQELMIPRDSITDKLQCFNHPCVPGMPFDLLHYILKYEQQSVLQHPNIRNNSVFKRLLEGQKRDKGPYSKCNLLQIAIAAGNLSYIKHLIRYHGQYFPDLNVTANQHVAPEEEETEFTALMLAAYHGDSSVSELLLSRKADPNVIGYDGQTALFLAVQQGHHAVVQVLLLHNADPNPKSPADSNIWPHQPLPMSIYRKDVNTMTLLLKHGADINACAHGPEQGPTPCNIALQNNDIETIKLFINTVDSKKLDIYQSGLFVFSICNPELFKCLTEKGLINLKDKHQDMQTLRHALRLGCQIKCIQLNRKETLYIDLDAIRHILATTPPP